MEADKTDIIDMEADKADMEADKLVS